MAPSTLTSPGMISAQGWNSATPEIKTISGGDLRAALAAGLEDFKLMPSHLVFLTLIYPLLGIVLAALAFGNDLLPLVYPLITGFALLGPLAAIGMYELSRRRERGLPTGWTESFDVLRNPAIGSIAALGIMLLVLFGLWLLTAQALAGWLYGTQMPSSIVAFFGDVLTTGRGWTLIILGGLAGFAFAVLVLMVSVVSFPLLVDRNVGAATAVETSLRAVRANPGPMAVWGLTVAGLLALGSIPFFLGLAVVLPVLGHATWHLYRRLVVPVAAPAT